MRRLKMRIKKGDKEYTIIERKSYWSVSLISGGLTVDYQVNKDICATETELREYILKSEMF